MTPTLLLPLALCASPTSAHGQENESPIPVVVTLPYLADIVRAVGGGDVSVTTLVRPGVDPHHIQTTPAQTLDVGRGALLFENGMQLEAWVPRLVEASGNSSLAPGGTGHRFATNGLRAMEIPTAEDIAAGGHVHPAGNPHIWLDPLNLKVISRNIEQGLAAARPTLANRFAERRVAFELKIDEAFFGAELVALVGGRALERLHRADRLTQFLQKPFRGAPLIDRLGGWLARARALEERELFTYHSTWSYLAESLDLTVVETLEEKPGIPPGPAHLEALAALARERSVRTVVAPPYYPRTRIEGFAERIGAQAVTLPTQPGEEGTTGLFDLFDTVMSRLEAQLGTSRDG